MAKKILIVDDDADFLKLVHKVLSAGGYEVIKATNGRDALRVFFAHRPDMVILDVVMPAMGGLETCNRIREVSEAPVIIVTGEKSSEDAIVAGLEYGADDYLIKPVRNRELLARVRAVLRRAEPSAAAAEKNVTFSDGYLMVDVREHRVVVDGKPVKLTPREFRLLAYLVENAGHILSHKQLLEKVWGWEYTNDVDYLRIYVSHLRQKIEPEGEAHKYIITEPGFGYHFHKPDPLVPAEHSKEIPAA